MPQIHRRVLGTPRLILTVPRARCLPIRGPLLRRVIPDPAWLGYNFHFLIASMTSYIAFFLAMLMVCAAVRQRNARVVFLSLAYLVSPASLQCMILWPQARLCTAPTRGLASRHV